MQVNFVAGQSSALLSVPIVHDDDPDEGCEVLVLGVTDVTGINGSAVVVGGIHDVSAQAIVAIDEVDFSSRVLETESRVDVGEVAGGLSPGTAKAGRAVVRKCRAKQTENCNHHRKSSAKVSNRWNLH